jgi:hypothetical protein
MVTMVKRCCPGCEHVAVAKSATEKYVIQRQINATDVEIDRLVYTLYGLKADEIAIVEDEV